MPRRGPDGEAARARVSRLQVLWDQSVIANQIPGNAGGGRKVMEMLTASGFKPRQGSKA